MYNPYQYPQQQYMPQYPPMQSYYGMPSMSAYGMPQMMNNQYQQQQHMSQAAPIALHAQANATAPADSTLIQDMDDMHMGVPDEILNLETNPNQRK